VGIQCTRYKRRYKLPRCVLLGEIDRTCPQTTSSTFRSTSFSVLRRYSDFLWLYETLSLNNPGVVVPPVPEKNPFGRFEDTFVQQRRLGLEKCINKMANHPVLCKDSDLKLFLESDTFAYDVSTTVLQKSKLSLQYGQIKQRKAEIANERGGLMASIGQTITGPRFHETDEVLQPFKL
jgi:sorting nexin-1/2